jgi:flavin reductase (DIM6/NTAB) family NADH-FMN oxidoreductase RutF
VEADGPHPSFDPSEEPRAFRNALARFATGVAVVTTRGIDGPAGFTANSFASISLVPPLVLWAPAKASRRHDVFVKAEHFAIHILAGDQKELCEKFVRSADGFDAFAHTTTAEGVPVLQGCAAVFECTRSAVHDGGDHSIIVGRVRRASCLQGPTLVFQDGQFRTSQPEHATK